MECIYFSSRVYAASTLPLNAADFSRSSSTSSFLSTSSSRHQCAQHSTFRVHIRQPRHSTLYHPFIPITAMVQRGAPRARKTVVRGRRRALRASVRT